MVLCRLSIELKTEERVGWHGPVPEQRGGAGHGLMRCAPPFLLLLCRAEPIALDDGRPVVTICYP